MARIWKPSTPAAGGTPWKGRLRSYHVTPQSSPPQRPPSRARSPEAAEEAQTSKNGAAPKITRRGGSRDEDAGAALPPKAPLRRSPRLTGRDPEHPIVIDEADKECKGRDGQSAITSLRRSPQFHMGNENSATSLLPSNPQQTSHSRKTRNASRKGENQRNVKSQSAIRPLRRSPRFHTENKDSVTSLLPPNPQQTSCNRKIRSASRKDENQRNIRSSHRNAAANTLSRTNMLEEQSSPGQNSQDIPPKPKNADLSRKKSEEKELRANRCEVLKKKRKRGTEGRPLSVRKGYQKPRSMPPDCQEAAPSNDTRKLTCKQSGNDASFVVRPNIGDMKLMNVKDNNEEPSGIEREGKEPFCGQDDWTEEQDMALHQAYFTARPSPHFWKRVSRMVPGRSAEECFNRIHADLSTPTPIAPRPRRCKAKFSPLGNFSLSDPELPNLLEPTVGRQRTSKQKNLAAQKTVRHLLQKHCFIDQTQGADHFSMFESSPSALQLNISFENSPGTPRSSMNSGSLRKSSASSSARKKPFSRLKNKQDEPSPAVLKPVKNAVLHEKYIDRLFRREGTKRPRRRTTGSKAADITKAHSEQQAGDLKAAKNALISEATDFISHFKKLQANSLANVEEISEDDEIEFDAGNCNDDE